MVNGFIKVNAHLLLRCCGLKRTVGNIYCAQKRLLWTKNNSKSKFKLDISGIYPPIVTPFDWEENIYWDKLEINLRLWNKCHFKGMLCIEMYRKF